jgi:peptide-methionine (S)-S-oxide reductase
MFGEQFQMADAKRETTVLGGGCFWCLEAVFDRLKGVTAVESGYMGGKRENPTYEQVCSGTTGHVEVARVMFDPSVLTFRELLEVFFAIHDPTTLDRQGYDSGTQYRSVIFYMSEEQKRDAEAVIAELNAQHIWSDPIVTAVEPAGKFFIAEDYHQEYYANNSYQPYCQAVISPKMAKFRQKFATKMKA